MNEKIDLSFDTKAYSLDAIKRAVYDCITDGIFIFIKTVVDDVAAVTIMSNVQPLGGVIQDFSTKVLDHQIRIDLENKFGVIRDILIAQAMAPNVKINKIVSLIDG